MLNRTISHIRRGRRRRYKGVSARNELARMRGKY